MTVFLKYFSARFPLCTAQYQEHFTKCLLNEVNKCKTSVPHFKVGHIFVFFNKEVNSQHLCFCESNGVKCEQMGISKGMSFTQNGKEASYQEVPFPSHWQWACVHDKSFPSTQGMFILTYTFFFLHLRLRLSGLKSSPLCPQSLSKSCLSLRKIKSFLNKGAFSTQYAERAPWRKPPQGGSHPG